MTFNLAPTKSHRFDWPALFAAHAEVRRQRTWESWSDDDIQACHELVRRGCMRQLLTRAQRKFYDAYKSGQYRELAMWSGRKFGKSLMLLVIAYEHAIRHPGSVILLVLPELKQAKDICYPMVNELERFIPSELRPTLLRTEGRLRFANKAEIKLGGSKPENVESLRGPACHLLLLDEVAFFNSSNFHNALHNILRPQLTITGGPTLYATTPPRSPDHPFLTDVFPRLQSREAWFKFTVFDNPLVSAERILEIADGCGGFESESFLREFMGEVQADSSLRVIPEYDEERHVIAEHMRKDGFGDPVIDYRGYQVMDMGLVDFTGILTGFFDHNKCQLVITHERMFNSGDPNFCFDYCADEWRKMLDHINAFCSRITPTIDAWPQVAFEFRKQHRLEFQAPRKSKVEENIAFARACFEQDKVVVLESCQNLRYQLRTGIWNDQKTDFVRSTISGHLDLVMCLVYMLRSVDWKSRPGQDQIAGLRRLGKYDDPRLKEQRKSGPKIPALWKGAV